MQSWGKKMLVHGLPLITKEISVTVGIGHVSRVRVRSGEMIDYDPVVFVAGMWIGNLLCQFLTRKSLYFHRWEDMKVLRL